MEVNIIYFHTMLGIWLAYFIKKRTPESANIKYELFKEYIKL